MKNFIFYTTDGITLDNYSNTTENCQILGFSMGKSATNAFDNLIKENNYILEHKYKSIISIEVIGDRISL